MNYLMDIIFICIIWGGALFDTKKNYDEVISKETSMYLRGICSVIILFHHIGQKINSMIFSYMGTIPVSVFFFLSAYGLLLSTRRGKNYWKHIIRCKIPALISISTFTIVMRIIIGMAVGESFNFGMLIGIFRGNTLINWYFPAIIYIYLIFAILTKGVFDEKNVVFYLFIIFGISGLVLLILHKFGIVGEHWVMSIFGFPFGALYALQEDNIKMHLSLYKTIEKWALISITIVLFVWVHYYHQYSGMISTAIAIVVGNVISITGCMSIINLGLGHVSKVVFSWLGKHSAEMILIHLAFLL